MLKIKTIFLFLLIPALAESQNIYSALQMNKSREYKTRKPTKIIETNIFYNQSGIQKDKSIKLFDESGMLLSEERFDEEGNLKARLIHTNDTINKLVLTNKFERWERFGYSVEVSTYVYDSSKFLVSVIDKDQAGTTFRVTELKNDVHGNPTELSLFDGEGNLFGKEMAVYYYDRNKVVTSVFSNEGKLLSTDSMKIDFKLKSPGDEIHGPNTWVSTNWKGEETVYESEYVYDPSGNCTSEIIYKVKTKADGTPKKEIDRIFRKDYSY